MINTTGISIPQEISNANNCVILHIILLLLKPEFQGRGIGEKSMVQIQAAADALQLPVTLSCFTNNHRALAFYQRLGYRIISSDKNFADLTNAPIDSPY